MSDRSHVKISIGGPVRKKDWKKVVKAIAEEVGVDSVSASVHKHEKKLLKKATVLELQKVEERHTADWFAPAVLVSVPLKNLDRVAGAVVTFEVEEVADGFFAELQAVLRATKSLWYVVETTGFIGSWNSHISWWDPHDPERELPDFKWWYNKRGERVTPCVDARKSGLLPAISTPNLTRAFRIAQQELGQSSLPPETDREESLLARVIHIGMFVPTLPPISILED